MLATVLARGHNDDDGVYAGTPLAAEDIFNDEASLLPLQAAEESAPNDSRCERQHLDHCRFVHCAKGAVMIVMFISLTFVRRFKSYESN